MGEEVVQQMNYYAILLDSDPYAKFVTGILAIIMVVCLIPLLSSIIWYEKCGTNSRQTIINKLLSATSSSSGSRTRWQFRIDSGNDSSSSGSLLSASSLISFSIGSQVTSHFFYLEPLGSVKANTLN